MRFLITLDDLNAVNGYVIAPRQLAIALRASGHEAKIFCRVIPKVMFKGEGKDDFIVIGIGDLINRKLLASFNPSVIITNAFYPTDLVARDYAKKHKVINLFYVHARIEKMMKTRFIFGEYWPDFLINSVVNLFVDLLKDVDVIIALNDEMHEYIDNLFPGRDIEIVSNGIDLEMFPHTKRSVNEKEIINLLYVANFEARKNQLFLLDVMKYLPNNYHLHLVGGREDPSYYVQFRAKLRKMKGENVIFHGKLELSEVIPLYNQAHIFVDSSIMEAQSLVLLEAIASGLPIVRIYNHDTAGITKHEYSAIHVSDKDSANKFASAIEKLVRDKELYSRINHNDLSERKRYGREASVAQLLAVISKYKH
jgi:glycosyltransferase involved in cell wall biosynthesis